MRTKAFISFLCILLAVLTGCVNHDRVSARLDALDSLLNIVPASPGPDADYDSILVGLDTLMYDVIGDEGLEARWNLLYAMTEDKADRPLLFDTHVRPAYDYYMDATHDGTQGDSTLLHRFAQSCFYMGVYYYHSESTALLEQMMQKSADVAKSCGDHYTAYLALTYLSSTIAMANAKRAVSIALDALAEQEQAKDRNTYNRICVLENIANCHLYGDEKEKALPYYLESLDLSLSYGDSSLVGEILVNIGVYFQIIGDKESSMEYLRKSMPYLLKSRESREYLAASTIYLDNDSLEQAERFLKMALSFSPKATEKYLIYKQIVYISVRKHDEQAALAMGDSLDYYTRKVVSDERKAKDEYYELNNNIERKKKEIEYEKTSQQRLFLALVLGLIMVSLMMLILLRQKYVYKKNLLLLEQKRRKLLHDLRDIQLRQKETVINMLKRHMTEKSDIIARLRLIDKDNTSNVKIRQEDWIYLENTLDDIDDSFVSRLRMSHPTLDHDSIKLAMLLRIGLTVSQISVVFHLTTDAIKKRKKRLKQEVEIKPLKKEL